MKCPKCHSDYPSDSKFCKECGTQLLPTEGVSVSRTKTIQKPVSELAIGSTFAGRCIIAEVLGRGGMGTVYKAEDTRLKRNVALKFLPPELTHVPESKERFIREAQAAAALSHPNICTIHEIDEEEGKSFITMEYIDGQSIKEKVKEGSLEQEEVLDIAIQVAEGLEEAHRKGIIHRDIKSANIMVTKKGQAKIMDFGLAKMVGGTLITKEATTMGTVAYMSPEQARGQVVDQRTDIWSLGIVLYEMLTGQLPFKGEHEQSMIFYILNDEPEQMRGLRTGISSEMEKVVDTALAKNPDERYQHINELLDDLRSITEGLEPERIRARPCKVRLPRIKRVLLYAGIVGLVLIITLVIQSLFIGRAEAIDSIAVLPLQNLSGNPEQEYFSDGATDALINELAKISALRVISCQSVMRYKGSEKPFPEIAREIAERGAEAVPRVISARRLATIYEALEEKNEAFRWLEVSYEERESFFPWFKHGLDSLQDDPRFQDLLRRMNLPDNRMINKTKK